MQDALLKLQELVSYQQEDLTRLSGELYTQQQEISALQQQVKVLKVLVEQLQAEISTRPAGDEPPPPHY